VRDVFESTSVVRDRHDDDRQYRLAASVVARFADGTTDAVDVGDGVQYRSLSRHELKAKWRLATTGAWTDREHRRAEQAVLDLPEAPNLVPLFEAMSQPGSVHRR
jgi:hypothetical protein